MLFVCTPGKTRTPHSREEKRVPTFYLEQHANVTRYPLIPILNRLFARM